MNDMIHEHSVVEVRFFFWHLKGTAKHEEGYINSTG